MRTLGSVPQMSCTNFDEAIFDPILPHLHVSVHRYLPKLRNGIKFLLSGGENVRGFVVFIDTITFQIGWQNLLSFLNKTECFTVFVSVWQTQEKNRCSHSVSSGIIYFKTELRKIKLIRLSVSLGL